MTAPVPADIQAIAATRYEQAAAMARAASDAALEAWAQVDPAAIAASWLKLLVKPLAALVAAQTLTARRADDYVTDALRAQGVRSSPAGEVVPEAFAGRNSDGRPLANLLFQPAIKAMTLLDAGAPPEQALAAGAIDLDMIVRTQVADAGRVATGVAVAARPNVGWVRVLNPPSCSRCAILAGRTYKWSDGFQRHPRCDCIMAPVGEDVPNDLTADPRAYFESLAEPEQNRIFTNAGARAIRDGADMARVVNARSGMATTVGPSGRRRQTTERVFGRDAFTTSAGKGRSTAVRLMPEQIYLDAAGDRDEAVRLLRLHGYLTDRQAAPVRRARQRAAPVATFGQRAATAATGVDALTAARFGLDRRPRPAAFTAPMARAVNTYTGAEYNAINRHLRGQPLPYGYKAEDVIPVIKGLDRALAASKLSREVLVQRGIANAEPLFGDRLGGDLTGMAWREDAYLSTTASERRAAGFAGGNPASLIMRVLVPAGTQAVEASGMGLEGELLLRRGLRLRVVADHGVAPNGVRHIDVEVLGV